METGILLIKTDIAHFTLVNLEIDTVVLKLTEDESQRQKKVLWLLTSFR